MRIQGTPSPSQQLEELYCRYASSLYRRARFLTGEPEESLDITQATFLSFMLMTMREPLTGKASPYTVLYTIATHKAVDRLRRRARWTGKLDLRDDEDFERAERNLEVPTAYAGGVGWVEAVQDLALLTEGEKPKVLTAACLHLVEGHSITQAGQILHLRPDEVAQMLRGFLKRARARQARLERKESQ